MIIFIIIQQVFSYLTYDLIITNTTITQYQYGLQTLSIPQDCRTSTNNGPYLDYIWSTKSIKKFKLNMTCYDIVDNKQFLDAEIISNSTLNEITTDLRYQCTMDVNFNGESYCCCPNRKQFNVGDEELAALIIVPILLFFTLIGGCMFCLKQKIKKPEYFIVEQ